MTDLKHTVPTKLLWIDLEMTGLDAQKDIILEVAVEITDFAFKPLASYEAHLLHSRETVLKKMASNPWWESYPANRQAFLDKLESGKKSREAESELVALVQAQFGDEPAILAGNSVHADRAFIERYWPELYKLLHYRMLDVTAWKVVMQGKYGAEYAKKETHRAFDDIHESIEELQHYLTWLNKSVLDV